MDHATRQSKYLLTNRGRPLTPRQERQLRRMTVRQTAANSRAVLTSLLAKVTRAESSNHADHTTPTPTAD